MTKALLVVRRVEFRGGHKTSMVLGVWEDYVRAKEIALELDDSFKSMMPCQLTIVEGNKGHALGMDLKAFMEGLGVVGVQHAVEELEVQGAIEAPPDRPILLS